MHSREINPVAQRRYRAVMFFALGLSIFGSIFFLHREVLALKAEVAGERPGFVTIGHPEIPTCTLRFETGTTDAQALFDDRIWATLLICESEHRRLSRDTATPGTPL